MSKAKEEYYKSIFKKYLPDSEKIAFWYIKELEKQNEEMKELLKELKIFIGSLDCWCSDGVCDKLRIIEITLRRL